MDDRRSALEMNWNQILRKGYVYGIPFFFNGEFVPNTSKKDENLIQRGFIHRFPSTLRNKLSYLHERSSCTSGVRVEFNTDATAIQLFTKFSHIKHRENYSNMAQACMDILIDGKIWMNYFPKWENPEKIHLLNDRKIHRISLVFPNYARLRLNKLILYDLTDISQRSPPFLLENRPIVYYGSSITQGGCASRPSITYTHRLSETFCMNYINLGISGNGLGESIMADYISSFSHAILFVLDWGANLLDPKWGDILEERYEEFWRKIHSSNPNTPILFVGLQAFALDNYTESGFKERLKKKREFIKNQALIACKEINNTRNQKMFDYIEGTSIINTSSLELTLDGTHPNDLGHKTYAELLEWKIIDLLGNHVGS